MAAQFRDDRRCQSRRIEPCDRGLIGGEHAIAATEGDDAHGAPARAPRRPEAFEHQGGVDHSLDRADADDAHLVEDGVDDAIFSDQRPGMRHSCARRRSRAS